MKSAIIMGILLLITLIPDAVLTTNAHPHVIIDLMESHSHNIHDENFEENFLIHSFEHVLISTIDWFRYILFA